MSRGKIIKTYRNLLRKPLSQALAQGAGKMSICNDSHADATLARFDQAYELIVLISQRNVRKMEKSKLDTINSRLFIAVGILFSYNFFYILRPENIIDRIQVSLMTFAPVLIALLLFLIKKIDYYTLIRLPIKLFILTANLSTLLLYLFFAVKTNFFTTVEGWMSSSLYLLVIPIYSGIASLIVFLITFLVLIMVRLFRS